jgi:hypothetical protein
MAKNVESRKETLIADFADTTDDETPNAEPAKTRRIAAKRRKNRKRNREWTQINANDLKSGSGTRRGGAVRLLLVETRGDVTPRIALLSPGALTCRARIPNNNG